jgi:predicted permease
MNSHRWVFSMEHEKKDAWWKDAVVFYARTTAWILFPALLLFFFSKRISQSQSDFFVIIVAVIAVCVSFYGIYKEIELYKSKQNTTK